METAGAQPRLELVDVFRKTEGFHEPSRKSLTFRRGIQYREVHMYVFIGYDAPNGQELRKLHRPAHLDKLMNLAQAGKVVIAGPFKDGSGSLIVYNVATKTEVELIAKTDPYVMHRVFERYEIRPFEKVLP
jgi:uncharacterized protein